MLSPTLPLIFPLQFLPQPPTPILLQFHLYFFLFLQPNVSTQHLLYVYEYLCDSKYSLQGPILKTVYVASRSHQMTIVPHLKSNFIIISSLNAWFCKFWFSQVLGILLQTLWVYFKSEHVESSKHGFSVITSPLILTVFPPLITYNILILGKGVWCEDFIYD